MAELAGTAPETAATMTEMSQTASAIRQESRGIAGNASVAGKAMSALSGLGGAQRDGIWKIEEEADRPK